MLAQFKFRTSFPIVFPYPSLLPDGQAEREHNHPAHNQRPVETKQRGRGWDIEGRYRAFEFGTTGKRRQGHTSFFAAG